MIIISWGGRGGDFEGLDADEIQEPLAVLILAVFLDIFLDEIEFAFHYVIKAFATHVVDVRCEHLSLESLEFEAILGQGANPWNGRREVWGVGVFLQALIIFPRLTEHKHLWRRCALEQAVAFAAFVLQ